MARVTNESLKRDIEDLQDKLSDVVDKLPNGQLAVLQIKLEDLKSDIYELATKQEGFIKNLYNPDDGVVTRVNKNTEYVTALKEERTLETIRVVDKFRSNYNKLMWGLYALILGALFKEQILKWLVG